MRTVDEYKQLNMAIVLMMWSIFYHCFVIAVLWAGHSTRNEVTYFRFVFQYFLDEWIPDT